MNDLSVKLRVLLFLFSLSPFIAEGATIFQDDFNYTDAFTNHGWDYTDGFSSHALNAGPDGSHALKITFSSGDQNRNHNWSPASNLQEIWVKFNFKFDCGSGNCVGGGKFLKLFGVRVGDNYANTTTQVVYQTGLLEGLLYGCTGTTRDAGTAIWYDGTRYCGETVTGARSGSIDARDGNWHTWKVRMRYNDNNQSNGIYEVYYDGTLIISATGVRNRDNTNSLYFETVQLGGWNQSYGGSAYYYLYDNFIVATTDPDAGSDTTAPVTTISGGNRDITSVPATVTGTASDAVGVSGCKYRIGAAPDGSNGTACTDTTSWSCSTTGYSQGANTLYVGCYDAAGNYGNSSITVTLDSILPTLSSSTIPSLGTTVAFAFNEAVTYAGAAPTLSSTGGPVTLSGCGAVSSTITCNTSRQVLGAETVQASYVANGIEDLAGNPLGDFGPENVLNQSAQQIVVLSSLLPTTGTRYHKEQASVNLGVSTNKDATCRYGVLSGLPWANLSPYSTSNNRTHTSSRTVQAGGGYQTCSRCLDTLAQQYSGDICTRYSVRPDRTRPSW